MTIALAIAIVVSIVAHYAYEALQAHKFAAEREAWTQERRELLTRIQAPERIPTDPSLTQGFIMPEPDKDEWARVGQIEIDDSYGLEDE